MQTTLDIVNQMLASTGTAPLTTNDTLHPFYIKAYNKLTSVSRTVQGEGWWFNRAIRTLKQDINGEIVLPSNTLHADPVDTSDNLVRRGTKLYDPANATYTIGRDVKIVFVDEVDIEDLPPQAQDYIASRAVYEFYRDEDGTQPKLNEYKEQRVTTYVKFKQENLRNADTNWFNSVSYLQMRRGYRGNRLPVTDGQE